MYSEREKEVSRNTPYFKPATIMKEEPSVF